VLALDRRRRQMLAEVETLKNQRNTVSKEIGIKKEAGEDISETQKAMREVGDRIGEIDKQVTQIEEQLGATLLAIPNVPHASVPRGKDASENVVVRQHGEPKTFAFA